MSIGEYIGFMVAKPVLWVPLLIFLISTTLEIILLFLFACTQNKRKTACVILGANLLYVFGSELIFKILYGTWFTTVYNVGRRDFFIRLVCSLVIVLTLGNVLLKKEITRVWLFNVVLGAGIIAAAIASLWVEGLMFM